MNESRMRILLLPALLPLLAPLRAATGFWDEIPPSPSTTRPAVVLDDYWNSEFQRVNREIAAAKDPQVLFFGDSLTWSWSLGPATGKAMWDKHFAPYQPINMGNSGDITPVMLHRVTRGNLDFPAGVHPKVAVLLCGINNLGVTSSAGGKERWELGKDCPPEDIAHGQRAIAQVFRRKLPGTRVVMLALLPLADRAKWEKVRRVNAIQEAVSRDAGEVAFLNLQDLFLQPDGNIDRALFTDGLHLSPEGYRKLAEGLAPVIGKFAKSPPLDPVKILLIGGSATEGPDSSRCYRRYLDGLLRRKGHAIDFIGSRRKHLDDTVEADSYEFDPDHEGHPGKSPAWLAENMARLLVGRAPDIAVIHPDEPVDEGSLRHFQRVVEVLRARNPEVRILFVNSGSAASRKTASGLLKKGIASAPTSPFRVVEFDGIAASTDGFSSPEQAVKMAAELAGAIAPLISSGKPSKDR